MPVIHINNKSFSSIPAFPLKGVHLFPHMFLPLTIFEPRYVELVDYALETKKNHLISIATPLEDGLEGEPPQLRPILGAGLIIAKQEVSPKRYNILVRGVTRILLKEELEQTHLFRQVEAEILQDEEVNQDELQLRENELRNLIQVYAQAHPKSAEDLYLILNHSTDAEVLSHLLGARIPCPPQEKQRIFEELNPVKRLALIKHHLSTMLLTTTRSDDPCVH